MSECFYDCSVHPPTVQPDPDITGFGVLIGYIATAGIVVAIVTVHYFLVHQPDLDPFRYQDGTIEPNQDVPFRQNPVDTMFLGRLRRAQRKRPSSIRWSRFGPPVIKLHCGLSCYHWNIVGWQAWFSSLTHLSCLTLLRNHLYNHPAEHQWRLLFMFILIVMLITSMAPTGNYDWDHIEIVNRPSQPDYAICYYSEPPARSSAA